MNIVKARIERALSQFEICAEHWRPEAP